MNNLLFREALRKGRSSKCLSLRNLRIKGLSSGGNHHESCPVQERNIARIQNQSGSVRKVDELDRLQKKTIDARWSEMVNSCHKTHRIELTMIHSQYAVQQYS